MNVSKVMFIVLLTPIILVGCKKRVKLENTVVSVKEVKDIGQLITAEYYGEVVSSYSLINADTIKSTILNAYTSLINNKVAAEAMATKFDEKIPKNISSDDDPDWVRKLKLKATRQRFKAFKKSLSPREKADLKILQRSTGLNKKELFKQLTKEENGLQKLTASRNTKINEYIEKNTKKADVAYLGRGIVQVGYDLQLLDSLNIFLSPEQDTVFLLDFDPILFSVDINPWFYYEETDSIREDEILAEPLYGFELIKVLHPKAVSLEMITKVKSECKRKLREEALDRDILEKAKTNAEDVLLSFFQLLTLTPGQVVDKVVISHSKYFEDKVEYLYDQTIDSLELAEINYVLETDTLELDSVAFPQQTLDYQKEYLDRFIVDLYIGTLGMNNTPAWEASYTTYFNTRKIVINQ